MTKGQEEVIQFYKKRIEPFVAVFIVALLLTTVYLLVDDRSLKKEISKNCGFETEDYKCYCEKSEIIRFQIENLTSNFIENKINNLSLKNVSLDW